MASVEPSGKSKRRLLRPDMTAMVDVAFLLLMFFVLTASVCKNKGMNVVIPSDGGDERVDCNTVLTVYLGNDDQVFLSGGCDQYPVLTDWNTTGLRNELVKAKTTVKGLVVVLKPGISSNYKNFVDAVDEFSIAGIKKYAIAQMNEQDEKIFSDHRIKLN